MTDGVFLLHIVDALNETIDFTKDITPGDFFSSPLLIRAVTASFEIAGEATKNLSEGFRHAHPEVAWRELAAFRDVLIHAYFGIDASQLWTGAKDFAPDAVAKIGQMTEYRSARASLGAP
jgi:uncharacterized protein with HEPN domain